MYCQTSIIKGTTINDATGKTLSGVSVTVKDTKFKAVSDSEGNFTIRGLEVGKFDLEFSAPGFDTKIISEVETLKNDVTNLTVSMVEKNNQLKEVVITTTKAKTESIKSLLTMQKNSVSVSDGVSAETIKRTPDRNTSDVLKRISGASIQDNKFVVVRGLNDRYNACFLNGAPLPSSEPDRKAFSFDVFPSNMLDNLVITKTATPDMTGDFAGGLIQITTKNIPDKNFQTLSIGGGSHSLTTGNKQVYYEGGKTDWIGLDDGTRAIPSLPDSDTFRNKLTSAQKQPYAQAFNSDWALKEKTFAPNFNFQYALGRRIAIGEKTLGVLLSLSHNKNNVYSETTRSSFDTPGFIQKQYFNNIFAEQYLSAAMANFSLKFNSNNNISFKNIYSINSDDKVILRNGFANGDASILIKGSSRWFTSNQIYSTQLTGNHYFEKSKFRIEWVTSYSNVKRDIPSLRANASSLDTSDPNNKYVVFIGSGISTSSSDYPGFMFYAQSNERIYNAKVDFTHKFEINSKFSHDIKYGPYIQQRKRNFYSRSFNYTSYDGNFIAVSKPDEEIFSPSKIGPVTDGLTVSEGTQWYDEYYAESVLKAGYLMFDNKLNKVRFVWGLRAENYKQIVDMTNVLNKVGTANNVDNTQSHLLPSANFIWSVTKKQNIRLSYSKTLNRPEFRELASFKFYDFLYDTNTQGNPDLRTAQIQNGDFRYEIYPGKNQIFSISAFYKKFTDPIEVKRTINNNELIYQNALSAVNYGFETEFRTVLGSLFNTENSTLLNNLTLFSNLSIINSKLDVSNIASSTDSQKDRPMQGQSPYVFNAGIQFLDAKYGWGISANANRIGNRISIAGNIESGQVDIWEKSRTFLDAQISKSFMNKKFEVKMNFGNILAQDLIFYQNNIDNSTATGMDGLFNSIFTGDKNNTNAYNADTDDLVWVTKIGRTFSFSLSYTF